MAIEEKVSLMEEKTTLPSGAVFYVVLPDGSYGKVSVETLSGLLSTGATIEEVLEAITPLQSDIDTHVANVNNPHQTDLGQVLTEGNIATDIGIDLIDGLETSKLKLLSNLIRVSDFDENNGVEIQSDKISRFKDGFSTNIGFEEPSINANVTFRNISGTPALLSDIPASTPITDVTLGTAINGFTAETPVDADSITFSDVSDSDKAKKVTFANLKAFLKTYFDTLYATASSITSALATFKTANFLDATSSIQTQIDSKANLTQVGNLIRQEFTFSGSQTFTLSSNYGQVYSVEVQGQGALSTTQYTLVSPNQITINDTLDSGDYVVVLYSNAIAGIQPYYSQAEVDAFLNSKISGTGASGQVSFFNGANSQIGSNDLFWDNLNNRLRISQLTDAGFKLDVNGTARVQGITTITPIALTGSDATSALDISQTWNTTGAPNAINLNVTDTASNAFSPLIRLRKNNITRFEVVKAGQIAVGGGILTPDGGVIATCNPTTGSFVEGANAIYFGGKLGSQVGYLFWVQPQTLTRSVTTGESGILKTKDTFNPTSGNGSFNCASIGATINQTGTANGITRGLLIDPILTSAFDFRAIENSVGKVCLNTTSGNTMIGTATDVASAKLQVSSTTQGFLPPRMTNAQRIAISSPAIGLMVYCTDAVEGVYVNKSTGWIFIG